MFEVGGDKAFTMRLPRGGGIASFGGFQNVTRQVPEQLVALLGTGGLDDLQKVPSNWI